MLRIALGHVIAYRHTARLAELLAGALVHRFSFD
jgi:hypothetical protein